jgi:catechol 2,3-dioxygenase
MTGLADYTVRFNDKEALTTALAALETQEIATAKTAEGYALKDPWGIGLTLAA